MITGRYIIKMDEKGRLRLPVRLKDELGKKYYVSKGDSGALFIMDTVSYEQYCLKYRNEIAGMDISIQRRLQRALFSSAHEVEEDAQGRFLLPQILREYANISKDVVIIGMFDRVEVWAKERWDEYSEASDIDELLKQVNAKQNNG